MEKKKKKKKTAAEKQRTTNTKGEADRRAMNGQGVWGWGSNNMTEAWGKG